MKQVKTNLPDVSIFVKVEQISTNQLAGIPSRDAKLVSNVFRFFSFSLKDRGILNATFYVSLKCADGS